MAHSMEFLHGSEAVSGRKARRDGYAADQSLIGGDLLFVVHAEVLGGFAELDCTDIDHARNMAEAWVKNGIAQTASIKRVYDDGSIGKPVGRIICGSEFDDCADDLFAE